MIPFVIAESALNLLLRFPSALKYCPAPLVNLVKNTYLTYHRKIIQTESACAGHDPVVGYKLRPGKSFFSNPEFRNEFSVNSAGFRDDEASLLSPAIIVAGDSYAMGWGVEQNRTFAQLIESQTQLTVLNTAISSYGTVREMMLLDQIDVSGLRFLLIQYCGNDLAENEAFFNNGNKLDAMTREEFNANVKYDKDNQAYYFGKYTLNALKNILRKLRRRTEPPPVESSTVNEAGLFLNALMNAHRADLSRVEIIVFQTNSGNKIDRNFAPNLRKEIEAGDYPGYIKKMTVIDLFGKLENSCFYLLDGHLNAEGHRAVANILIGIISESQTGKGIAHE